jgi:putative ABC transport system permease protein
MPPTRRAIPRLRDALGGDIRFALRYFARHKATTAIIIAVIALATGANTLIFSTVQAQFLRPAPAVPNNHAQVRIWAMERPTRAGRWEQRGFTLPELTALAARPEVLSRVAAWMDEDIILDGRDSSGARGVGAQFVSANYFRTLGVPLAAGLDFSQNTAGDTPDMTAVMAYAMAEQLYGSAAAAVGHRILVDEVPVYVVGVAPPRFQGAMRNMDEPALWMPLSARADVARVSPRWLIDDAQLSLFATLAPGASREQATALAKQVVASALPDSAARTGLARNAEVRGMQSLPPGSDSSEEGLAFTFIMGVGILILLVAWMNVSSLMVAAAVGRRHEIAVRLSLGASRARLLRQLVTESTILAVVGTAIGLTLAWWMMLYQMKTEIDGVDLSPDLGTFAFVFVMAIATGIFFGLSPAMHATCGAVSNALRDAGTGSSSRSRLQRGFVVAQIALSQPLLVLLGTMLALVVAEYHPLAPEMSRNVIAATFRPLTKTGGANQRPEAVDSLIPRIAELPEVLGAVPDPTAFEIRGIFAPDRAAQNANADTVPTVVHVQGTAPGWFTLVGVPIVLGRDVALADTAAANHPVVIGSDVARRLWGDASAIGRTLVSPPLNGLKQDSMTMTVIGVYDASRQLPGMTWNGQTARGDTPISLFTAFGKHWRHDRILVRTRGPAAPFVPELRRYARDHAAALPVTSMQTLAQIDQHDYSEALQVSMFAGAGGALALLLASLGLYGVVSLAVKQRTREIGVRIAVGAEPIQVARMFLASGVRSSAIALAIGLPLSVAGLEIAMSQGVVIAPQVNPYLVGSVIALVLLAVAVAATWVPARRAALIDPASTLRVE